MARMALILELYGIDPLTKAKASASTRIFPGFIPEDRVLAKVGNNVIVREGMFDVMIKNAFTPFAEGTYVKIDKP